MKIYSISIPHQGYDTYDAHIIVANSVSDVLRLAQDKSEGLEGKEIWLNSLIKLEGEYVGVSKDDIPFILLSSFNAG